MKERYLRLTSRMISLVLLTWLVYFLAMPISTMALEHFTCYDPEDPDCQTAMYGRCVGEYADIWMCYQVRCYDRFDRLISIDFCEIFPRK